MDLDTFGIMKSYHLVLVLICILCGACHKEPEKLQTLDLQSHGLPITILAPDSAVVLEKDYDTMRDITVRKGNQFFLQIFEFDGTYLDAAGEKLRQLEAVKEDPRFREVIQEEDFGFIYSRQADSATLQYDFRHVKIRGQKELIFQTGLIGNFSLDEVRTMYRAVK